MNICIIPARAGSKRIPGKNTKDFYGLPVITYAIRTALESDLFGDHIYVSTDSDEIGKIGLRYFAQYLPRPAGLADDHTTTAQVMRHAVRQILEGDSSITLKHDLGVCCLYPCTPFITARTLVKGHKVLQDGGRNYVVPVTEFKMQRALRLEALAPVPVWPQFADVRTQDLEPRYRDAGQFYWGRAQCWLGSVPIYGGGSHALLLEPDEAIDIDTEADWQMAEAIMRGRA